MPTPIPQQPFADARRAAGLMLHWLDDNDAGMKQVLMESGDLNRDPFLIMALLNLTLDLFPDLFAKSPEIHERLLEMAYAEVDEEANNRD